MDLGSCENRILLEDGAASKFEAAKKLKGGFNMKKTYQEPVTEIVAFEVADVITTSRVATEIYPAYGSDGKDGLGNYQGK